MKTPRKRSSAKPESLATKAPASDEAPAFEDGIANLESIVGRLEGGELALEDALDAFEEGVGVARVLAERLTQAEQRVDVLLREGDEARTQPLDGADGDDA